MLYETHLEQVLGTYDPQLSFGGGRCRGDVLEPVRRNNGTTLCL
jgi:hypothetical protein